MSTENEKKIKAIELMIVCAGQFPNCPIISTNEIVSMLDRRRADTKMEDMASRSPPVADSLTISKCDMVNQDQVVGHVSEVTSLKIGQFLYEDELNMILVDVRSKNERDVSMIPGAITSDEFENLIKNNPNMDKSRLIVPYCTIGYRSGKYGSYLLKECGFTNVRNGEGIVLWTHAVGSSLVVQVGGAEKCTNEVHTFGSAWDLASDKYSTVQFGTLSFILQGLSAFFAG